jgi:membrane protein
VKKTAVKKNALAVAFLAFLAGLTIRRHPPQARISTGTVPVEMRDLGRGDERPGGIKGKLYSLGDRFRPLAVALRVQDRFGELNGNYLAGAITLQAFLALFPLLLLILSVAGFIAAERNPNLAVELIAKLGIEGEAAVTVREALDRAVETRGTTLGIGTIGLLWSGLGLVGAMQYAYNQVWQVEPRGIKDKLIGVEWLFGAAILFVGSAAATTVLGLLPGFLWPISILVTLAVNVVLWLWTAKLLPNRDVGWRPLLPGAIFGAVGLEVLKLVGRFYVPALVASSSRVYGSIGVVFAILAWLYFFGRLIVYSACLNVVLWEERAGTVKATIEVPATDQASTQVRRSGQAKDDADNDAGSAADSDANHPADDPEPQAA